MGFNIATIKEIIECDNIDGIKEQFLNRSAQIKEDMTNLKTITSPRRFNENDERGCC